MTRISVQDACDSPAVTCECTRHCSKVFVQFLCSARNVNVVSIFRTSAGIRSPNDVFTSALNDKVSPGCNLCGSLSPCSVTTHGPQSALMKTLCRFRSPTVRFLPSIVRCRTCEFSTVSISLVWKMTPRTSRARVFTTSPRHPDCDRQGTCFEFFPSLLPLNTHEGVDTWLPVSWESDPRGTDGGEKICGSLVKARASARVDVPQHQNFCTRIRHACTVSRRSLDLSSTDNHQEPASVIPQEKKESQKNRRSINL